MPEANGATTEAISKDEPASAFQKAMDRLNAEHLLDAGIQRPFYMSPLNEDPEENTLWPPLPTNDGIHIKKPAFLKDAQIFSWSKKRRTRSLMLLDSPLTRSNLFGRSLAHIVLDPHDVHGDEELDFKKRDEDGNPVITLKDLGCEPDPDAAELNSKGIWSDPNKKPGEPDVWPPPHLAAALASIYSIGSLSLEDEPRQIPPGDTRGPPPEVEDEPVMVEPPSPIDSCPATPLLVPDVSPTSTQPTTPSSASSFQGTFQSMQMAENAGIDIVISEAPDNTINSALPSPAMTADFAALSPSTATCSTPATLSSPSSSTTFSSDSGPEDPSPPAPAPYRHRLEYAQPTPPVRKRRHISRPKQEMRFKAVVFPQAKEKTTAIISTTTTSSTPAAAANMNIAQLIISPSPSSSSTSSSTYAPSPSSVSSGNTATSPAAYPQPPAPNSNSTILIPGLNAPLPDRDARGRLPCAYCTNTYKNSHDFIRHVKQTHDPDYPGPKCHLCFKRLSRSDSVARHLVRNACGKRAALQRTIAVNRALGRA